MNENDLIPLSSIAEITGVAHRTVSKWIDSGRLKGHKLPSGTRRVLVKDLRSFMLQYGIPIESLDNWLKENS